MVFAGKQDAGVDLVGEHPQIVLDGEFGDTREGAIVKDGAGGIVGRIENQNASSGGDFGGDFGEIRLKLIFLDQSERNGFGTQATGERRIDGKTGIGIEDFVARLDERHHGEGKRHLAAGRNQDLFRLKREFSGAREIVGDFLAQRRNAAGGAITIAAGGHGIAKRIYNGCRGMKIGFAEFEMNDGAALALEFLGAGEDGERAFTGKL